MAGLAGVEFLEEVVGELGLLPNEGVEVMGGQCWGVDGRVGISRHVSAVEDAEGVSAEGGVGLAMLKGEGPLLWLVALGPLAWGGGLGVVEVPCWGR